LLQRRFSKATATSLSFNLLACFSNIQRVSTKDSGYKDTEVDLWRLAKSKSFGNFEEIQVMHIKSIFQSVRRVGL
jgi:hypothetical protein